jgi:hypothetical protein
LNTLRDDLLAFSAGFHEIEHFYRSQKPAWEKLRKAYGAFQLNRMELERDDVAGPALRRMKEVLASPKPYSSIKEADGLIATAQGVNATLLSASRADVIAKIDARITTLETDLSAANADAALRSSCLGALNDLKAGVQTEQSLAHVAQAESEAVRVLRFRPASDRRVNTRHSGDEARSADAEAEEASDRQAR